MGSFSIWHWLVVLVVVLILFGGGGKLSRLMGDAARGINAFKKGLKDDDKGEKPETGSSDSSDKVLQADTGEAVPDHANKDEAAKS